MNSEDIMDLPISTGHRSTLLKLHQQRQALYLRSGADATVDIKKIEAQILETMQAAGARSSAIDALRSEFARA
jgi:hypothetical protein